MEEILKEIETGKKREYIVGCVAKCYEWCKAAKREFDPQALIEWDEQNNERQLLDYDQERNFRRGLYLQAHLMITTYTRFQIGGMGKGQRISLPGYLSTDTGYKSTEDISSNEAGMILETFLTFVRQKTFRLRFFMSRWKIQTKTLDAIKQAELDFSKARRQRNRAKAQGVQIRGKKPGARRNS